MSGTMVRNWLSSVAVFSPPNEMGSDAATDISDQTGGESLDTGQTDGGSDHQDSGEDHSTPRKETIGESIRRAISEGKQKAAKAPSGSKSPISASATGADQAASSDASPHSAESSDGNTKPAPQGTVEAPSTWTKEEKALWNSLPEMARTAIIRREADAAKGVQELRNRYAEVDTAIAPYQAVMKQNRVTPGQAINQLFKWHMELAGPNKVAAFKQLAQNFGIDPATLAAVASSQGAAPVADPANIIPENLRPVISGLETRMKSFEDQNTAALQTAAQQTWMNWSKDKPHAEKVRALMANLINSDLALIQAGQDQVSNTIKNGSIDMDAAYQAAIYAHPEVRAAVLQEEQTKRDKAARDAVAAARKAGAGMRSGAPAGAVNSGRSNVPVVESPRESIQRALAELRGTQH